MSLHKTDQVWRVVGRVAVGCGGLALAGAPMVTWLQVVLMGKPHLFHVLNIHGDSGVVVWLAVFIGLSVSIMALTNIAARVLGFFAATVGALGVIAVVVFLTTVGENSEMTFFLCGPWIALLGCVSLVTGGIMMIGQLTGETLVANDGEAQSLAARVGATGARPRS